MCDKQQSDTNKKYKIKMIQKIIIFIFIIMSYKKKKKIIKEKQQSEKFHPIYIALKKEMNDFNKRLKNLPPNTLMDMRQFK